MVTKLFKSIKWYQQLHMTLSCHSFRTHQTPPTNSPQIDSLTKFVVSCSFKSLIFTCLSHTTKTACILHWLAPKHGLDSFDFAQRTAKIKRTAIRTQHLNIEISLTDLNFWSRVLRFLFESIQSMDRILFVFSIKTSVSTN